MDMLFKPRKRQDLIELTDKVFKLKSAIRFKLELETQIDLQKKLLRSMKRTGLWNILLMLVAFFTWQRMRYKNQIEMSKLRADLDVKEKQKNIYQRNEDFLEKEFEHIYPEMDERYEFYLSRLKNLYSRYAGIDDDEADLPVKDIEILHTKWKLDPPAIKTDKLSFYLTMEELLYRCQKG